MQISRSVLAVALVGMLAAACGSSTPTQAPGAATQNPGGGDATTDPGGGGGGGATTNPGGGGGGGGGAGDTSHGKIHIEVSGPVTKTADYGFLPTGSIFGGDQGSALNFAASENATEIVSIITVPDQPVTLSYLGADFQAPGATCTTSNWNIGATSGSGSFDCTAAVVIMASGGTVTNVKIKGSFDAHV